jgi:hypothetical protein
MDFVEAVKDLDLHEMICLTDQEATYAERLAIKAYGPEDQQESACGRYSTKLKSFILYLRHGVKQSIIKEHNLEAILCHDQAPSRYIF